MSQEGLFILTKPSYIQTACTGWLPGLQQAREFEAPNPFSGKVETRRSYLPENYKLPEVDASQGALALEASRPVAVDMSLGGGWRSLAEGRVAFLGSMQDEDDEEVEDGFEVYVFEVSDDDADALLGSNPAWKSYADRELRHAAGLRAYFYLDSY
jgi:hypothetical protein